jgi:CO/xanthine dehydrogenase FAD-binding subunit
MPEMAPALAAAACALDAAVHAWDVAVAIGQPSPLTAALAEQLMPAARATAEPLRGFAYAPALPARPSDDAAAALLRYLGRNPHWTPDGN